MPQALSAYKPNPTPTHFIVHRDQLEQKLDKELRHNTSALHVRTKRVARRYAKAVYVRARSYKTKVTGK